MEDVLLVLRCRERMGCGCWKCERRPLRWKEGGERPRRAPARWSKARLAAPPVGREGIRHRRVLCPTRVFKLHVVGMEVPSVVSGLGAA